MSTGSDQLDPDRLESAEFPLVRRGFEPDLVRTQLAIAATEIRRLRNLVAEVEGELARLEARSPGDLEAEKITEAIGEEAVKVLDAARTAAAERAVRAEAEAQAVVAAAQETAADLRSQAEAGRAEMLEQAEISADSLVEQGRIRGREMVAEAQTVRERMLRDLAQKRQQHRAEVEQLRAGRDRLLESLADTQGRLDDSISDLVNAVPEAQAAAERAGLRVAGEPVLTVEQLEAEISTARLIAHPLVDGLADPDAVDMDEPVSVSEADVVDDEQPHPPYDVDAEAEAEAEADLEADLEAEAAIEAEPEVEADDEDVTVVDEPEAPAEVDDLFARLRSGRVQAVAEAEAVLAEHLETEVLAERNDPDPDTDADGDGTTQDDDLDEVAPVASLDELSCADAVDEISRSLKRVLVDEQGDLLDGLRRDGADRLRALLESDSASPYLGALSEPLEALVVALTGDDVVISTDEAHASVRALLVEPVRARLGAALEDSEDPEELGTTVRAVYRECRTRRVGEAAEAAVSVVFEAAMGSRTPAAG